MTARIPAPGITIYSATKAYLRSFGKSLHYEFRPYGVGVTTVCPAAIATPLYRMSPRLMNWGLKTGDVVGVRLDTEDRSLIFGDCEIRVQSDQEDLALMHIDTDEANAAGMKPMNGYIVEF